MIILLLVLSIFFSVASQVMQKYVALASTHRRVPIIKQPLFWMAMVSLGLSMVCWTGVLSSMDLGKAYPILSANYAVMLFLSWLLFKETVPPIRILGVSIIMVGIVVMGIS